MFICVQSLPLFYVIFHKCKINCWYLDKNVWCVSDYFYFFFFQFEVFVFVFLFLILFFFIFLLCFWLFILLFLFLFSFCCFCLFVCFLLLFILFLCCFCTWYISGPFIFFVWWPSKGLHPITFFNCGSSYSTPFFIREMK